MTIYGALSNFLPSVHLMTYHTTNQQGTLEFLEELAERVDALNLVEKPYLVMDNHPAHHARCLRPVLEHFTPLYLPGYSSHLSSVETCWSHLKHYLNKYFARLEYNIDDYAEYLEEIETIMGEWAVVTDPAPFLMAARGDWLKVIEQM